MIKDYSIEQYSDADRKEVLNLMQETFTSEGMSKSNYFNHNLWRWQYKDNPSGKAITILAKDNGSVIGQYVNVPLHLKFNGKIQKSALVIDLMVRKPYRRQGLFKRMGEAANSKLSELGLWISIAFPSRDESYTGFVNKLHWFKVGELKTLFKPILPRIFKNKILPDEIKINQIFAFPKEINQLWEGLKPSISIGIVRDREYLNWRYFGKPSSRYEVFLVLRDNMPVGYFVLKVVSVLKVKLGIIVDMFCLNELDIVKTIINKAESYFLQSGAFFYTILKTKLYGDLLRRLGFKILPYKLSPKSYTLIARTNIEGLDLANLSNPDNWFLNFGDWDVI